MRDDPGQLFEKHVVELLDRYFLNTIPPSEADSVGVELQKAGIDSDRLEQLRAMWNSPPVTRLSADAWVARLEQAVRSSSSRAADVAMPGEGASYRSSGVSVNNQQSRFPLFRLRAGWYAGAGVFTVMFALLLGWNAGNTRLNTQQIEQGSIYTTKQGELATVTLPDGSQVVLNVASRLDVPGDFGVNHRTVVLHGEAVFNVASQQDVPFTVMAGSATTRVLGTKFLVRHYSTDTATTVAVSNGKVAVRSVVVPADWQANVGADGDIRLHPADASQFTFISGVLTLKDMALPDAITMLARWYGADIRLASPELASMHITATCRLGSLDDLAAILEFTLDVRVERIGRTFTIYPKAS